MSFAATGYYQCDEVMPSRAISESLALEVEPLGIKVMIVEPGTVPDRTGQDDRCWRRRTVIEDYGPTAGKRKEQSRERSGKQQGESGTRGRGNCAGGRNPASRRGTCCWASRRTRWR